MYTYRLDCNLRYFQLTTQFLFPPSPVICFIISLHHGCESYFLLPPSPKKKTLSLPPGDICVVFHVNIFGGHGIPFTPPPTTTVYALQLPASLLFFFFNWNRAPATITHRRDPDEVCEREGEGDTTPAVYFGAKKVLPSFERLGRRHTINHA